MATPINLKPFKGKETNVLRTRSPLNFANISSRGKILVTVENKYTIEEIDPDVDVDPNAVALITLANTVGIPSFRFAGDDMKATTSFLLEYDEIPYVQARLDALGDKVYIDWYDEYYRTIIAQYTEESLNSMNTTDLSTLITEIESKLGIDIIVTGTGASGGVLKADKITAILGVI